MQAMFICVCKAVSDKRIAQLAGEGVVSLRELVRQTGLGTGCGKCVPEAREHLRRCTPAAALETSPDELARCA